MGLVMSDNPAADARANRPRWKPSPAQCQYRAGNRDRCREAASTEVVTVRGIAQHSRALALCVHHAELVLGEAQRTRTRAPGVIEW